MIEGLRAEIPEVFAFAGRIPRPRVPAASPATAAAYGFGVHWLVGGMLQGVVALYFTVATPIFPGQPPIREVIALLSTAAAMAVARRSGGWWAALVLGLVLAAGDVGGRLVLAHANAVTCATVPGFCRPFLAPPLPWATAGGALLGVIAAGLLRAGTTQRSVTLLAAAFLAAVYPIVRLLLEPFGQSTGPDAALKSDIIVTAQLVAAALAGVAIGARGRRLWLSVAVFVLVYSLPWAYTLRFWLTERPPQPFMFQIEWQMLIPLLNALALLTAAILARMVVSLRRVGRAGPATDASGPVPR